MLTDEIRAVMLVMAIKDVATECTEEPAYDKMPKSMGAALKVEAESILYERSGIKLGVLQPLNPKYFYCGSGSIRLLRNCFSK